MRAVCFHGRRELGGDGLFLRAARVFSEAAVRAGFSAQVRTPGFPSPAGAPDRAVVKISKTPPTDLAIPTAYDLEIVCDPHLAAAPSMGESLKKPGGVLVLDAPEAVEREGVRVVSLDLGAVASKHSAAPEATRLGAALAAWETLEPGLSARHVVEAYREIHGEPMRAAEEEALNESMLKAVNKLNIK